MINSRNIIVIAQYFHKLYVQETRLAVITVGAYLCLHWKYITKIRIPFLTIFFSAPFASMIVVVFLGLVA